MSAAAVVTGPGDFLYVFDQVAEVTADGPLDAPVKPDNGDMPYTAWAFADPETAALTTLQIAEAERGRLRIAVQDAIYDAVGGLVVAVGGWSGPLGVPLEGGECTISAEDRAACRWAYEHVRLREILSGQRAETVFTHMRRTAMAVVEYQLSEGGF